MLGVRRSSIITAAWGLLVHGWDGGGPEVVLDFAVSRRGTDKLKTIPGWLPGWFRWRCRHHPLPQLLSCVRRRIRGRDVLRHQRFPYTRCAGPSAESR
ncbi:linear gramicidin synthetase subunit D domain protein [Mycobacterium ulcerans str. Harvey]|uniref:Linear gramicidin synthetase subunit D domain protein n=1 Tax=Mycobacterium ulcerans str. Harvey TaxID=1299332 RepID=A0ABN0R0T8_MYCUL|nr:linear gramicidin synthetase subunit D domain protein [Mycobacterium ulcerans str. Harvey]